MALSLSIKGLPPRNATQQGVITGLWAFRQAEPFGYACLHAGKTLKRYKGEFQAVRGPAFEGNRWQVELLEEGAVADLDYMEESLYGGSWDGRGPISRLPIASPRFEEVKEPRHQGLMEALRDALGARYGQVQEMHVLFRERRRKRMHHPGNLDQPEKSTSLFRWKGRYSAIDPPASQTRPQ